MNTIELVRKVPSFCKRSKYQIFIDGDLIEALSNILDAVFDYIF